MHAHGSTVLSAARGYLAEIYTQKHGTPPAEGIVVNGVRHFPKSAMEVVDLHINDTPDMVDGFERTFEAFAFNLPNFSRFATVFPVPLRTAMGAAVLALGSDVSAADAALTARATDLERHDTRHPARRGLTAMRETLAVLPEVKAREEHLRSKRKPGEPPREFVGSPSWNFYTAGLREGLAWMAEMSREATGLRDYADKRLGRAGLGHVDPEAVWAFVGEVIARKIPWLGQATGPNFLKDAGLVEFVKPDVHTIRIVRAIDQASASVDDEDWRAEEAIVFKAMVRYANEAGVWPRVMDRALWLVGSGFFHYQPSSPLPGGEERADELARRIDSQAIPLAA